MLDKIIGGVAAIGIICFLLVKSLDAGGLDAMMNRATPVNSEAETAPAAPPKRQGYIGELRIAQHQNGHFYARPRIENVEIDVLIDTGASMLALRESDARYAGLRPRRSEYTIPVNTANGTTYAAQMTARYLELGPLQMKNVTVYVLPDQGLDISLLGMSILSQAARVEIEDRELIIEAR
ncbi:MAG: retropepsin-like aspartic protease family protein [bacterium]